MSRVNVPDITDSSRVVRAVERLLPTARWSLNVELWLKRGMNLIRNFVLGITTATLTRYIWSSFHSVKYPTPYTVCTTEGGIIYTVDEANPTAECISIDNGRLVAVGSRGEFLFRLERYRR